MKRVKSSLMAQGRSFPSCRPQAARFRPRAALVSLRNQVSEKGSVGSAPISTKRSMTARAPPVTLGLKGTAPFLGNEPLGVHP